MMLMLFAFMPFWLLLTFSASIATFLSFQWWQMHPLYGKNVGPPILPFVGSFFSLVRNQHRMYDWATQLLKQSPTLTIRSVLFGIELYITANPANVEHMLKTNFRNYTKGFRFQSLMQDMLGHGIFNVDGELWKAQRKAASYEFTSNSLKTLMLETVQKEIADRLLPMMYAHAYNSSCSTCRSSYERHDTLQQRHLCARQTPIDLQDIFLRFAFDNVCQISLGVDTACLNHALQNQGFAKAFDDTTELIIQRFFVPAWIWKLKRFLNVGSERKLKNALHVVHSFATEVIRKRKEERNGTLIGVSKTHQHADLLNRLLGVASQMKDGQPHDELRSKVSEDRGAYSSFRKLVTEQEEAKSEELLRDMIISFLLAGRDTSSIALSWFFWLLIQHPAVEAAIYEEIVRVVQGRKKPECTDVREDDADGRSPHRGKTYPNKEMPKQASERGTDDVQGGKGCAYDIDMGTRHAYDTDVDTSGQAHNARVGDDLLTYAHVGDAHVDNMAMKGSPHTPDQGQLHNEAFTYKELQDMKFLQAALQETMRLYPPVPHDTKLVVKGETLPDGTHIRSGAQLAYHTYAMGRMKSLWGEDCEEFRPERWLAEERGSGEAGLVNESPFKWPVFQAGPRTCLGKDMAMLQMKCVAAALIERFTFSMPASFPSPTYSLSFTLKMQHGLPLLLHPRF